MIPVPGRTPCPAHLLVRAPIEAAMAAFVTMTIIAPRLTQMDRN
jgi:hypothetical protein